MRWTLFAALLMLALAVLASGCDVGDSQEPSVDGLLTRSLEGDEEEMAALLRGTLELDPDRGCVLLSGKPVVWPAGTTLTTDPPEIHLPGGLNARPGDVVTGGGGEVPGKTIRDTAIRIEGDLTGALDCASVETAVVVFTARGDDIRISSGD